MTARSCFGPDVMGLTTDYFLDQPFKTQNHFQNDQISVSNSSPRRHTNFRLRAAAPQIVAKLRRRRRRLSGQAGNSVKRALKLATICVEVEARSRFVWANSLTVCSATVIWPVQDHY